MLGRYLKKASRTLMIVTVLATGVMAQNTLTLNVNEAKYKIKRTIYGGLLEDWGRDIYDGLYVGTTSTIPNTNGMRNDIIEALKDIKIGVMQFPGGCKAEIYAWKDGIGPKTSRPGGEKLNGMGTDEYFQLCSLVGSAPFIQANCKGGSTAQMTAWLKYIDTTYPGQLKYLGIGNEPWGGCYAGIPVNTYITDWYEKFNNAIPESFKDKLVRIASYWTDMASTDTIVRRLHGKMEGLSYHYYTTTDWNDDKRSVATGFDENDYYNIMRLAYAIEPGLNDVISRMNRIDPEYTAGLQPDEWGAWYKPTTTMGKSYQQSTVRDALITGQHLNFFNNNCRRIWLAQVAQPVNVIQSLFLTNPTSGQLIKTPTYYTYKLYKPHQNATMIPNSLTCGKVSSSNLNTLTASASIDSTKTVHISITNIDASKSQDLKISLNGYSYTKVTGEIVNGPQFNSYNDYGVAENINVKALPDANIVTNGNNGLTVTLPAHSVVMLTLQTGTGIIEHTMEMPVSMSVSSLSGQKVLVRHGFTKPTSVALSMYTVDGKLIAPVFKTVVGSDPKSFVWNPELENNNINTVVVTLDAEGKTHSQRLVLHRSCR